MRDVKPLLLIGGAGLALILLARTRRAGSSGGGTALDDILSLLGAIKAPEPLLLQPYVPSSGPSDLDKILAAENPPPVATLPYDTPLPPAAAPPLAQPLPPVPWYNGGGGDGGGGGIGGGDPGGSSGSDTVDEPSSTSMMWSV